MTEQKVQWHPAFYAAMRIELEQDAEILNFLEEYQLSHKPMQVDVVVVKKVQNVKVRKNIGHIFRGHNIVQYKSPEDYMSVSDFYKTYGYACFYQSMTNCTPGEITITYICNRYPYKMLRHLENERKYKITKHDAGIYYIRGDYFPMQLIITKRLSKNKNFWMQMLRSNLKAGREIDELAKKYQGHQSSELYRSVMNVIMQANWKEMQEGKRMCEMLRELFAEDWQEAMEKGIVKGREEGREEGISFLVEALVELGIDRNSIKNRILNKYAISEEKCERYLERFDFAK